MIHNGRIHCSGTTYPGFPAVRENLEKGLFLEKVRENLEKSGNICKFSQKPWKCLEFDGF